MNITQYIRLYDIFFSGPTYIMYGYYLEHKILQKILYIYGFLTFLLNYVYFTYNKNNILYKLFSIDIIFRKKNKYNKTQFIRLLLLSVYYPIIYNSLKYYSKKGPKILLKITIIKIIIGYLYNLYYFIKYL
jgi:hypothetical protein